jgi:hypothetical protein
LFPVNFKERKTKVFPEIRCFLNVAGWLFMREKPFNGSAGRERQAENRMSGLELFTGAFKSSSKLPIEIASATGQAGSTRQGRSLRVIARRVSIACG